MFLRFCDTRCREKPEKTEKPKIQETLHKSGLGLMFMGFWQVGVVGNNFGTHPPLLSRHLTLQNLRNINFLLIFSIFQWGPTKSHMSFYNSYPLNFVTMLKRSALKSQCHCQKFRIGFLKIIKINQPNRFQTLTFCRNLGFHKPGSRLRQPPPGGLYFQKWPPTNIFFWKCQKT